MLEKASSTVGTYGQLMEPVFPLTFDSLEQPITRKEMSLLISNMLYNVFCKDMVKVNDIKSMIADYNSIDTSYLDAIEQAYGQGILAGYPDGTFNAEGILTRAEGISVVARLFFADRRVEVEFPFVDADHNRRRDDRFRLRRNPKIGVGAHRAFRFDVGPTDRFDR